MNRDPIEESGGLNVYGFVGNNAIFKIDMLGLLMNYYEEMYGLPKADSYEVNDGSTIEIPVARYIVEAATAEIPFNIGPAVSPTHDDGCIPYWYNQITGAGYGPIRRNPRILVRQCIISGWWLWCVRGVQRVYCYEECGYRFARLAWREYCEPLEDCRQ